MKRLNSKDLRPGMKTAEDVYTYTNQLLIPKGTVLSDKSITKLEFYSILNVRVEDDASFDKVNKEKERQDLINKAYSERIRNSEEFKEFKSRFDKLLPEFKNMLDSVALSDKDIKLDELFTFTSGLIHSDAGFLSVFDMLHCMRSYDDMTYVHSLNVALMCNVFSRWLRMDPEETKMATLCGLLHDIGKITVPNDILNKPAALTENEYTLVKKHTLEGFNVLRGKNVPTNIMNSALMHHERCDGSGYPFGIKNAKIDTYAKMVAIVDVYDAMTSARIYRGPLCPFKVVEIFEQEGLQKYDTRFIMTFLENIVNTYMLHRVRLSDGREGDVVFINRSDLAHPTIKTPDGFVDLSMESGVTIDALV
ncbi:MAG: HD-GYP domain-containing protein [Lachnospiraceae bacterium]|nr:HD-GYP domain-containing protein [Lachnospiraceae bacterium]